MITRERHEVEQLKALIIWIESLRDINDSLWTTPIAPGKWSIQGIISHIMLWDKYFLENAIEPITKHATITTQHLDFNEFNVHLKIPNILEVDRHDHHLPEVSNVGYGDKFNHETACIIVLEQTSACIIGDSYPDNNKTPLYTTDVLLRGDAGWAVLSYVNGHDETAARTYQSSGIRQRPISMRMP